MPMERRVRERGLRAVVRRGRQSLLRRLRHAPVVQHHVRGWRDLRNRGRRGRALRDDSDRADCVARRTMRLGRRRACVLRGPGRALLRRDPALSRLPAGRLWAAVWRNRRRRHVPVRRLWLLRFARYSALRGSGCGWRSVRRCSGTQLPSTRKVSGEPLRFSKPIVVRVALTTPAKRRRKARAARPGAGGRATNLTALASERKHLPASDLAVLAFIRPRRQNRPLVGSAWRLARGPCQGTRMKKKRP